MSMTLEKQENKIRVLIPNSEATISAQVKGIKDSEVTGYYTNDKVEFKQELVQFLDDDFEYFLNIEATKKLINDLSDEEVYKYNNLFKDNFTNLISSKEYFEKIDNNFVRIPKMFFSGDNDRYFKFENTDPVIKKLRAILYGDITGFDIEKKDNNIYLITPFIKENATNILEKKLEKLSSKKQYWTYSPGENASEWEYCLNNDKLVIGWDKLGNLKNINLKDDLADLVKETYEEQNPFNSIKCIDDFYNNLKVGDIVIAKIGMTKLLGYGEVIDNNYFYDESRTRYKHTKNVKWKLSGLWELPNDLKVAQKTLTNITDYENFAEKLMDIMLNNNINENLKKFIEFYNNNIEEIKKEEVLLNGIIERKQFVEEYPIDRLINLSLDEYCLGTENSRDSLSHKLEFGKYKTTAFGIGGGYSSKHIIYIGNDGKYHGAKGEILEHPQEYFNEFKKELYSFLKNIPNSINDLRTKYPMLTSYQMILTKLCSLYYPNDFINMGAGYKLKKLCDLFEVKLPETDKITSTELSYILNNYFKINVTNIEYDDPQWLGHALWRFLELVEKEGEVQMEENKYTKDDFLNEVFIDGDKYDSMVSILEKKKNIILEGAPGVGKTFMAKRLAYSIIGAKDSDKVELIQFHQSYSYEDFIEGYRPTVNGFELKRGIFYNLCEKAKNDLNNNYYIIIDEINRGNLSKIFGELLMLIESDKRGEELTLAYSEESFSVPENLYIIGLMNTADRSLALIDYALRRRFSFIRIEPAFESKKFKEVFAEKFDGDFYYVIDIIKKINDAIKDDSSLGAGFKIGHSYFCPNLKDRKGNKKDIEDIIQYEIMPLLEEYWYDDEDTLIQWENEFKSAGILND